MYLVVSRGYVKTVHISKKTINVTFNTIILLLCITWLPARVLQVNHYITSLKMPYLFTLDVLYTPHKHK